MKGALLLAGLALAAGKAPSTNVPCHDMKEYMPPAMSQAYNISKHNGTWYEVAFRDLYPWGPLCDCQQSIKYVNEEEGYIDDYFVFTCGIFNYLSPQRENTTNGATGEEHQNGLFDMYVRYSDFHFIMNFEWNTEMIGFKDDGQEQYAWVIEWQCGTRPLLPPLLCAKNPKGCYFTGVQMFVRDLDKRDEARQEMIAYLNGLGPETSKSLESAWIMNDFGQGTFPPWFKNVTERQKKGVDHCPRPCSSGVYNETTRMWGCPSEHKGKPLLSAPPRAAHVDPTVPAYGHLPSHWDVSRAPR